jgi:hypothetical protein
LGHATDRQVIDQLRLAVNVDDCQIFPRDDDPVVAYLSGERQIAGRRKQNWNTIELLVLQQLSHPAGYLFP